VFLLLWRWLKNLGIKIRDIIKRDALNFLRFHIHDYKGGFALIMSKKPYQSYEEVIRLETSSKRLIQLANDVLTYFDQKAKIKEWKPTNEEYIWALERKFGKGNDMYLFVIDWVRQVVNIKDKEGIEQARQIYEWLKGNEDWLYGN